MNHQPVTDNIKISKFLSLVLRHKPEKIGIVLDDSGWTDVDELIRLTNQSGRRLTRAMLEQVVAENDKKRYAFSDDGRRIRASQGHSVDVDLNLPPAAPPEVLYHGTATHFLDSIRADGLHAASRKHVHLSLDETTAIKVGQRHGRPVVLTVQTGAMAADGHTFYVSDNGVWLTEQVPSRYLVFSA
jgi:putative RNA 2'-phosphotransferase